MLRDGRDVDGVGERIRRFMKYVHQLCVYALLLLIVS
jgi:hypothetical protein